MTAPPRPDPDALPPPAPLTALEGLVRRLARTAHADRWMVRGSLVTRFYCAPWPRTAVDLDLLDLDDVDRARTEARAEAMLGVELDDGCRYGARPLGVEDIWAETPWPGVRLRVAASVDGWSGEVQVDVAFRDPVVPPPRWLDLPTGAGEARVLVCARETMIAWKLHGLFEHGLGTFRPKDLHDLALLTRGATLDEEALLAALRMAFGSRDTPLGWLDRIAAGTAGRSRWSLTKWQRFVAANPTLGVPPLSDVVAEVSASLGPLLVKAMESADGT